MLRNIRGIRATGGGCYYPRWRNELLGTDGETGILVPPSDPDALARALLTLINNPAQRQAFGHAGRQRAEQLFTLDRMVAETAQLYETLLSEQSK